MLYNDIKQIIHRFTFLYRTKVYNNDYRYQIYKHNNHIVCFNVWYNWRNLSYKHGHSMIFTMIFTRTQRTYDLPKNY